MENIAIKKVSIDGIIELQKIGRETFFETFSESNTDENMAKYLEDEFSLEKLEVELNNKNSDFCFS